MPGTGTSTVEVTNISKHGLWLLLDGRELFPSSYDFPWFKQPQSMRSCSSTDRLRDICVGRTSMSI
jgi:hypothetical protein